MTSRAGVGTFVAETAPRAIAADVHDRLVRSLTTQAELLARVEAAGGKNRAQRCNVTNIGFNDSGTVRKHRDITPFERGIVEVVEVIHDRYPVSPRE